MGYSTITWTNSEFESIDLNDHESTWWTRNRDGLWSPIFELNSSEYPQQAGSKFNFVKTRERMISLPIELRADSQIGLIALLREFTYKLNPDIGEGYLLVTTSDGNSRFLRCRPTGINKVMERENTASLILTWVANDPYWYKSMQSSQTFELGDEASFFPIFPIRLAQSSSFAEATVVNSGDVETWAVFLIDGPATDPVIENTSTGKKIDLTGLTIPSLYRLVIDTRPGVKSVLLYDSYSDYVSASEYLSLDSSLFPLIRGGNSLVFRISSPDSETNVQLDYYLRYLSP